LFLHLAVHRLHPPHLYPAYLMFSGRKIAHKTEKEFEMQIRMQVRMQSRPHLRMQFRLRGNDDCLIVRYPNRQSLALLQNLGKQGFHRDAFRFRRQPSNYGSTVPYNLSYTRRIGNCGVHQSTDAAREDVQGIGK